MTCKSKWHIKSIYITHPAQYTTFAAMKVLVLRFSSIGDIVLTTPVLRCIKQQFPDTEIHYATKRAFAPVLSQNPHITKLHLLEGSLWALAKSLREEEFDYVIDLHHNQRTQLLKWMLGKPSRAFHKANFEKWLMVHFKWNRLPESHIVQRYLHACQPLGVKEDELGLEYYLSSDDVVDVKTLPSAFHNGYIAWVIGAKQKTKQFPIEKIAAIIPQLNIPVVLLGGPEDQTSGQQIIDSLPAEVNAFNACGAYRLNQSASLVQQANVVVTNDTGLMHIAAAFNKKIVSLWGNTIPEFGMYPYYGSVSQTKSLVLQVNKLSCRPCSKLGYSQCPKGHFKCMQEIDNLKVIEAIRLALV